MFFLIKADIFNTYPKLKYSGQSIKDVRTKSRKIDPSPVVRKMSALTEPLPPCLCRHTINFEKSEVYTINFENFASKVRTSAYENPLPSCPKNICTG